jgi:hypothetical protein
LNLQQRLWQGVAVHAYLAAVHILG